MRELALFPLSQIVLPEGQMRLRIFEQRYQRLVKEACAGKRAFAMALLNPYVAQEHPDRIFSVATEVAVTDFTQLDDGLLGITVAGLQRVKIVKRWQEQDDLHVAQVDSLTAWPALPLQPEYQPLRDELQQIFKQNPQLEALYNQPDWQNSSWLAQRWIEVLSMQPPLKHQLMAAENAAPTLEALTHWLQQDAAN